ncbi:MAG TPA: fumarylacetoacetate hydrolase family protein [Candidatus Dormibacteraeota bacterium]|nr:fumarylacetoacetate hydrolase family protein [Candidatus Dormibacteraeota bacterium]
MKLAHYCTDGQPRVGIVEAGKLYDLKAIPSIGSGAAGNWTIDTILSKGLLASVRRDAEETLRGASGIPVESVKLMSPILNPEKILLMAVNYHAHSTESKRESVPGEPYLFTKFRNALIGPGDPVLIPKISQDVDWEVELSVVIGRAGKNIARNDAMGYVAGYAVSNDISFRDLQYSTRLPDGNTKLGLNWVKGKGLDASFPLGPWLVTSDEIPDPHKLRISLAVNGRTRQESTTGDTVFKIDRIIEYVSQGMTLKPGDIISTGTPAGVGAYSGGRYLKDGDVLDGTIEKIGTLRNPVRTEPPTSELV